MLELIVILVILLYKKQGGLSNDPRWKRNRNLGNIRDFNISWKGRIGTDVGPGGPFVIFDSYENGLRAMMIDIRGDIADGQNTITKLISEYAPASENNTALYIQQISQWSGIGPHELIWFDYYTASKLIPAMVLKESGPQAQELARQIFNKTFNML